MSIGRYLSSVGLLYNSICIFFSNNIIHGVNCLHRRHCAACELRRSDWDNCAHVRGTKGGPCGFPGLPTYRVQRILPTSRWAGARQAQRASTLSFFPRSRVENRKSRSRNSTRQDSRCARPTTRRRRADPNGPRSRNLRQAFLHYRSRAEFPSRPRWLLPRA